MILIDSVAEAPKGIVTVDMYHRGHLSMRTGTDVTVCLLPTSSRPDGLSGIEEIVVSPISFDSWEYLVRITALFIDRVGVVRKLANAMQAMKLNVVYEESATVENSRFHRIEVLAHTRELVQAQDSKAKDGRILENDLSILPTIERRLKAICLDELVSHGGRPRLKVRPMEGLRNAHRLAKQSGIESNFRTTIESKGKLPIPPQIMKSLRERLSIKSPRIILISDTRDRLLRGLVPRDDIGFTFVRVRHRDLIGSLYRISDAISNGFTAIATLTRLKKQDVKNDIELLLYSRLFPHPNQESERKAVVSQLLSESSLTELEIEIAYPKKPGSQVPPKDWYAPEFRGLQVVGLREPVDGEENIMGMSTAEIVALRMRAYDSAPLKDEFVTTQEKRQAAVEIATAEGVLPKMPQVFISYRFQKSSQISKIKGMLHTDPIVCFVDGKDPSGPVPFREIIRDRIKYSQGFIGVWPAEGPLDWLLWELGVAHAFGIPILILPHQRLDLKAHERLMPERHFSPYNDRNLFKQLESAWEWFRPTVLEKHQQQLSSRLSGHD